MWGKLTAVAGVAHLEDNIGVNVVIELVLGAGTWVKRLSHYLSRRKEPKNKYKVIQQQLNSLTELWPRSEYS